jgi:hypothetical protein
MYRWYYNLSNSIPKKETSNELYLKEELGLNKSLIQKPYLERF